MAIRILTPFYWLGQEKGYPATNFDESSLEDNSTYAINEHVNVQVSVFVDLVLFRV